MESTMPLTLRKGTEDKEVWVGVLCAAHVLGIHVLESGTVIGQPYAFCLRTALGDVGFVKRELEGLKPVDVRELVKIRWVATQMRAAE